MSSFLETIGEALIAYWSSPLTLSVVAVCGACMGTLLYVFVTNARNAKLRVSLLTGLYALSIFFWAFVAVSFSLCAAEARMVAYAHNGVPMAVLGAVAGGSIATGSISAIVWRYGNAAVIRRFGFRRSICGSSNLMRLWPSQSAGKSGTSWCPGGFFRSWKKMNSRLLPLMN